GRWRRRFVLGDYGRLGGFYFAGGRSSSVEDDADGLDYPTPLTATLLANAERIVLKALASLKNLMTGLTRVHVGWHCSTNRKGQFTPGAIARAALNYRVRLSSGGSPFPAGRNNSGGVNECRE